MWNTKRTGNLSWTILFHTACWGLHAHSLPLYVACEVVSISKINRWEAEGCGSFSNRPKPRWIYREIELIMLEAHETQPNW